jgi:hypothetical protein
MKQTAEDMAIARLEAISRQLHAAQEAYDDALVQAYRSGASARAIGKAVGRETSFSGVWMKAKKLAESNGNMD